MKRLSHGICVFLSYIIFLQIIALPGGCVALEWWLHSAGVTVRRYPMTEGREAQQDGAWLQGRLGNIFIRTVMCLLPIVLLRRRDSRGKGAAFASKKLKNRLGWGGGSL